MGENIIKGETDKNARMRHVEAITNLGVLLHSNVIST